MILHSKLLITLTAIFILAPLQQAAAEIYKTSDKDGKVIYTDSPGTNKAETIKLPEINTQPATTAIIPPLKQSPEEEIAEKTKAYHLKITSPADNSHITVGQTKLASSLLISPKLEKEHKIQFYMDGIAYGKASKSTSITFIQLYRGSHKIHASVINEKGKVLKSADPVTVYVHRPRNNK